MKTVKEIVELSAHFLGERGVERSRRQAEELVSDALQLDRVALYMDFDRPLQELELLRCRQALQRRGLREPQAYIRGSVEFMGLSLSVDSRVLIPRQETEILVDRLVTLLEKENLSGVELWDICCGSGCIGLALKAKLPELKVVLSDLSQGAVELARENAERHQLDVEILQGDLFAPFEGRCAHWVVSNPPYITESEYRGLEPEVKDHEPLEALVGGKDGLQLYRRFAEELPSYLHPNAQIYFEMGRSQGASLVEIFSGTPWSHPKIEKDWSGNDRFFFLEFL